MWTGSIQGRGDETRRPSWRIRRPGLAAAAASGLGKPSGCSALFPAAGVWVYLESHLHSRAPQGLQTMRYVGHHSASKMEPWCLALLHCNDSPPNLHGNQHKLLHTGVVFIHARQDNTSKSPGQLSLAQWPRDPGSHRRNRENRNTTEHGPPRGI